MKKTVLKRVDNFLGLNNQLNPASAEYREGMAYRAKDCRLSDKGLWVARPKLSATVGAPDTLAAWGSGNHFKNLAVQGTDKIITGIATTESLAVGSNEILYGTTGSGPVTRQLENATKSDVAAPTNPTVANPPADTAAAELTRMEDGTYFYIFTSYNDTYKHESVPAVAYQVDVADASANAVTMTLTDNAAGDEVRIYRTTRTSTSAGIYSPNNRFYYVGKTTGDAQAFIDRLNDQEIINNEYDARGSTPPEDMDYIVSWNNRMYYFKDNVVYWSSAGRPQEVAQEFDLATETYEGSYGEEPSVYVDIKIVPKLSIGFYGEAKYEIAELSSKTVTAAIPRDGKLWVFTANTCGYLIATNQLEGVRYKEFRKGVGCVNDKCLAFTPYGTFGADRQGMWLLNNYGELKRISDGSIDLLAGADTTVTQSYVSDSFLLWVPVLEEVWWCMQYADTPTYIQIVYQANRGIFTGPYSHSITGGCDYVSTSGAYAYVYAGAAYIVDQTTADTTVAQYLDFWLGQSAPFADKDNLEVEMFHSATPGADVSVSIYQNDIASTSGITADTTSYGTSTKQIEAHSQGKLFKIAITLPSAGAPLALFNCRYEIAGYDWPEKL